MNLELAAKTMIDEMQRITGYGLSATTAQIIAEKMQAALSAQVQPAAERGDVDDLALAQHAYAAFHGVGIEQAKLNWGTRSEQSHEQWHAIVRSVRSMLAATPGDGMVRVPREPTPNMCSAAVADFTTGELYEDPANIWRAMLAASPAAPAAGAERSATVDGEPVDECPTCGGTGVVPESYAGAERRGED